MTILFRARKTLLDSVRSDLERRHAFAGERVGFFACRPARLENGGLLIVVADYEPLADDDYVNDRSAAAVMGPNAIRKAMQRALNGGAGDLSLFHVHMHNHRGIPGFSGIDLREDRKFVPDFFNVAPSVPHGAIVLSRNKAAGLCWTARGEEPRPVNRFEIVGAPFSFWGHS
jgi:hypothetical protein